MDAVNFEHIAIILLAVSHVTASSSFSMTYFQVADGMVPINGATAVGPVFVCSVQRCAGECNRLRLRCSGFTFRTSSNRSENLLDNGYCQPVTFPDLGSVVLGPSSKQLFFAANLCARDGVKCANTSTCDMNRWPHVCGCPPGYAGERCNIGTITHIYKLFCIIFRGQQRGNERTHELVNLSVRHDLLVERYHHNTKFEAIIGRRCFSLQSYLRFL